MDQPTESMITEINILPDGRVCLFGASRQVLELLDAIDWDEASLQSRIDQIHASKTAARDVAHLTNRIARP